MNLLAEKEIIIKEIQTCNEEWVIKAIKRILHDDSEIDIDLYNNELEEAEMQIKNGEYISHEALIEKMKAW